MFMVELGAMGPVVVEPVVNREKLLELLALQTEYPELDFKAGCDLRRGCTDHKRNLVELAKDVAAMSVVGGYVVIGVDKRGAPTGRLTDAQVEMLDEARLRPMLLSWLPDSLVIRTQAHDVEDAQVALVYVAPNPAGCVFFKADGQYGQDKSARAVFRQGEVYFRDGTESRRLTQQGLELVIARRVASAHAEWEQAHAAEYRRLAEQLRSGSVAQETARGPAAEINWELKPERLAAVGVELLRSQDDIPLRLLLTQVPARARGLLRDGDLEELTGLLDRLVCLIALFVTLERPAWFDRGVAALAEIYELPLAEPGGQHSTPPVVTVTFWLRVAERVLGVGALAVRRGDWGVVRRLAAPSCAGCRWASTPHLDSACGRDDVPGRSPASTARGATHSAVAAQPGS
ncbi:hypothetical protein [Nonomuraea sp. NPDC049695]|uniref:RNA-binding domain-containing protein n=1 Tax=Nonomuraea sp. NPDC049695 TaxID=3154734 RepID=UPI00341C3DA1